MGRAALFSMQGQAHSGRSLHQVGTGSVARRETCAYREARIEIARIQIFLASSLLLTLTGQELRSYFALRARSFFLRRPLRGRPRKRRLLRTVQDSGAPARVCDRRGSCRLT